jgi:flagellar basal-body rod modification protein FlgD
MTVVPPVSGAPAASSQTAASNPNAALSKDGFLKLFVAQLQHQDPGSPMDTSDSMNQMASFSMVEQITNMASSNSKIAAQLSTSSSVELIGRVVSYLGADGAPKSGTVETVATSKDGVASLTISGQTGIDPKSITQVA